MSQPIAHNFPLRVGPADDFAKVRHALSSAQFDADTLCRTLHIKAMSDIASVSLGEVDFGTVPDALPLLVGLFFGQCILPRTEVERVLGRSELDAFLALGIFATEGADPGNCYATVLLYPVAGFWVASDRHNNPDGSPFVAPPDIVFPAIYGGTLRFLDLLPRSHAKSALDLCSGSGIGAFLLSRTSTRAIASDVTARATHFARFNCALNGLGNVDIVCGDLYGAVPGRRFDRIVAHPPYVPSLNVAAIWRDGGATGEMLVRRIVEGLPDHLRAGGLSCVVSLGLDTKLGKFEDRVRGWLGERSHEFDIIFSVASERDPEEVLREIAKRDPHLTAADLGKLNAVIAEAAIVAMPYGALVIRRHSAGENRPGWTLRAKMSPSTDGQDLERAFTLRDRVLNADFDVRLPHSRPTLAPGLQVKVTHVVSEGSLVPSEYLFETDRPFIARGVVDEWMVRLISRFDGNSTPTDVLDKAKSSGEVPDGFGLNEFCGMLARMIERGYLLVHD